MILPGNSTTEIRDPPDPAPGLGQVLLSMRASTLCGSDIRAIYQEHPHRNGPGTDGSATAATPT